MKPTDVLHLKQKQSRSFGPKEWGGGDGIKVLRVASEVWGEGTYRPGLRPDHATVFLVRSGRILYGKTGEVAWQGELLWLGRGDRRWLECTGGDCHLSLVAVHGPAWERLLAKTWPPGEVLRGVTGEVISRFDQLLKEALKGRKTDHAACVLWLRLIGLEVAGKDERRGEPTSAYRLFATLRHLLVDARGAGPTPAELARRSGVTHAYVCRLFRAYEGMTPGGFVAKVRMRAAADELARDREKLDVVAQRWGYADAFGFSRAFKRVMGEAPSRYAARYR